MPSQVNVQSSIIFQDHSKGFEHNVLDCVYKSKHSGGLTTLPERVAETLVHGPCGDPAAGAVPGVVNIAGPSFGFCGVCGGCCDCCDGGIGDGRVGLGAVVVSEGRSSVECSGTRQSVPLLLLTR